MVFFQKRSYLPRQQSTAIPLPLLQDRMQQRSTQRNNTQDQTPLLQDRMQQRNAQRNNRKDQTPLLQDRRTKRNNTRGNATTYPPSQLWGVLLALLLTHRGPIPMLMRRQTFVNDAAVIGTMSHKQVRSSFPTFLNVTLNLLAGRHIIAPSRSTCLRLNKKAAVMLSCILVPHCGMVCM